LSVSKSLLRYGGFVLSVSTARVVGTILTAAAFPFLVRRLGVDMYGLWSYVVSVYGFTGLLANPGLSTYAAPAGGGFSQSCGLGPSSSVRVCGDRMVTNWSRKRQRYAAKQKLLEPPRQVGP
jgi:hypothetical protein